MAELQLKVVKNTGDGIWGKALNNFNKVLYSGSTLYNFVINSKRNALLKASGNYENITSIPNEAKRNSVTEKYEKAYDNYLNTLEKFITDTIYTRAQKRVSSIKENKILSQYYEVNSLKGSEYCEYKYKRQILLLSMDFENVLATKSGFYVDKYMKFYTNVMDSLYRGTMRHYAVRLTNQSEDKSSNFEKIYHLVEDYIKNVLTYLPETEGRKKIIDGYKKFVEPIDLYAKKEINSIKRELYLLELGLEIFSYCLPILAAEECYIDLIQRARIAVPNTYISADKFEMYNLLLDAMESYQYNVLAKKTVWDDNSEKLAHKAFWDKFSEYKKLERIDFDEYKRLREVLFVTEDMKYLKKTNQEMKELRAYYRDRMKQLGGLRKFKNTTKKMNGTWKTRRRLSA
ncbi:MAG: hypothetical protein IJ215_02175 [Clostridia bacterium]|nr:hypothetical protein [Clostridia bacterium]